MNLMKSVPDLEKDYLEIVRNLDAETIRAIEASPQFPPEQKGEIKFEHAHALYWQIQTQKNCPLIAM
ncbi:MAG: hypothetical protein A2845_03470 [Candidatus Lloydbacteria bacterium RIFCSPHIGHO2_01_FULL_49_22]|uniref:Uncharacterized protein n=1 Tax=Candidatus Lloydbacteria bacterium RIFCSPHIGHO2_01_FULL_49_22 TaxID=1798658 RepID=A0A1G2CZA1_9BACT|nr:MAG: hypothetical protein A2845_03470 [Candidatus Lloydbacteria bacterium RIFCSPHIGHO2_01_FULL_49_22]OGZ08991.1 MAG: hypothetical protein A3C14_03305 [Candidatus Lloydbacteria bacterium RIFCSPHIGHO2_02_FULL_50_18]